MITFRLALRGLFHAPWFAASVIVVLTVGMTLAIVAFAVVERALFRSLPFDRPGELFVLRAASGASARQLPAVSAREIDTWARVAPELSSTTIAAQSVEFPIDGIRARMAAIDGRFLDVLGVRPILGGFAPEDFQRVLRRIRGSPGSAGSPHSPVLAHVDGRRPAGRRANAGHI